MRREAGFTLLEMMVALVVLGLLLVGLAQGVGFGLGSYARQSAVLAQAGRRVAVDRALRRLITEARPGQAAGGAHVLHLITLLPEAVAGEDRWIDATIVVDRRHDLILVWSPHRAGVALRPAAPPRVERLARAVQRLDVGYWWPRTVFGAPVWRTRGPAGGLPRLIRLRIVGIGHHHRSAPVRWPALIAAPALATAH
ncbi:prepilin-type N-terminal cleavage/methylation domain-containing protein [Acidiphilium sp. PA]|uniref:prepilin-type N-terminal cleavage/methylation domain-containing protein n=1 Tax=Acidiphilium sp. PA TaxID=2871705 RepID=UPI0022441A1D|nr:prepilin-type N-terminal cleavage/methylation domain-containing protein [Acidiphilium sp. PA]MCW8305954.1 prepilin-type N-terminal cleavage/methylation domain-containing protein [Acidiphilium sp. PA]